MQIVLKPCVSPESPHFTQTTPGLVEPGRFEFLVAWNPDDKNHDLMLEFALESVAKVRDVCFAIAHYQLNAKGYVIGFSQELASDGCLNARAIIQLTGAIKFKKRSLVKDRFGVCKIS